MRAAQGEAHRLLDADYKRMKDKAPFDKAKWQREYMKEYRAGKRRRAVNKNKGDDK